MARSLFGGGPGDQVFGEILLGARTVYGEVTDANGDEAAVTLTVWSAKTGGTQLTDLLNAAGAAATTVVTSVGTGEIPQFQGPDAVTTVWVSPDSGTTRYRLFAGSAGGGGGGGDFTGPGSSTTSNLVGFNDTTGKVGKDSGIAAANVAVKSGDLSQFAATTSAQFRGVLSDETGTGAAVFATSPTLVTPALGTPSAAVLTNATGLPQAGVTSLVSDLAAKQASDQDLTDIAALSPTNDDVIQRKAGSWVNRTMAQLKVDLAITVASISDFASSVASAITTERSASATLTNKGLTLPVISSISNGGTLTLPTGTDTLVSRTSTDTLTNKTLTSPTLTTPVLGTPTSGTLTNCAGLPASGVGSGTIATARLGGGAASATTWLRGDSNWAGIAAQDVEGALNGQTAQIAAADTTAYVDAGGDWQLAKLPVANLAITGTPTGSKFLRDDGSWQTPAGGGGSGDVVGPASAVNNNLTAFDTTTGKLVKDSGLATSAVATLTGSQTLTNKTLTAPVVNSPTGIVKGDVGLGNVDNTSNATERAASATLTNKTLTAPVIATIVNTGTLTLPTSTDTVVGRATTDTLTNKTLTSPTLTTPVLGTPASGTLTNCTGLPQSGVTSLVTDLGNKQPLDADLTTIAGLTATTDNFMVSVSSAWASRTPAQVKTTLSLPTDTVTSLAAKAPLASPTFTGTPVLPNAIIDELSAAASGTSGTVTLDLSAARIFTLSPTANVTTLTLSNVPATGRAVTVTLLVTQGGTPRTIATPTGGIFMGAATPTQVASKACAFTYVTVDGGTVWYCTAAVQV